MIDKRRDYLALLELYVLMVDCLKGKEVSEHLIWKTDTQPIASKLFFHLGSLFYLWQGTSLPALAGNKIGYVDFASIALLARSAFETYLTFYYIFVAAPTSAEKQFRHTVWKLGGLLDRQRFTTLSEVGKRKIESEAKHIERLREEIVSHPLYAGLSVKHQKDSRDGKWRFGNSWLRLAEIAGSNKAYFTNLYSYLSSYAHSGYLGVLQVSQAETKDVQQMLSEMSVSVGLIVSSHFIFAYTNLFPETRIVIESHPNLKLVAESWYISPGEVTNL